MNRFIKTEGNFRILNLDKDMLEANTQLKDQLFKDIKEGEFNLVRSIYTLNGDQHSIVVNDNTQEINIASVRQSSFVPDCDWISYGYISLIKIGYYAITLETHVKAEKFRAQNIYRYEVEKNSAFLRFSGGGIDWGKSDLFG